MSTEKHLEEKSPQASAEHELSRSSARECLLQAAEKLFTARGYAAVSTREIAEEAQVNLGAIQYHFGSKAKLFIATVHRLMHTCAAMRASLGDQLDNLAPEEAARRLCHFIHGLLLNVLRPTGPQVTRVMCREILSQNSSDPEMFQELISSVVKEFTRPIRGDLMRILRSLTPQRSEQELKWCVASIIGQVNFYVTHRPFVEELDQHDLSASPHFEGLARHITEFSLRGLSCDEELIKRICKEACVATPNGDDYEAFQS